MKTKLFTFFFALVASVETMFADGGSLNGGLYYNYNSTNKTAEVTYRSYASYNGTYIYNKDWTIATAPIPSSIVYNSATYNVTGIGSHAFHGCYSLTSVTIPNSVTSIGESAFYGCSVLASITFGDGVKSIGDNAFYQCLSLGSVELPNSVTSIGVSAFSGCSGLTSVTIPNSVTSIGSSAFLNCSGLTHVIIDNSVMSINSGTFSGCTNLTAINLGENIQSIGSNAFKGCSSLRSITIPQSVTSIASDAFKNCNNLDSIKISNLTAWCNISFTSSSPTYSVHRLFLNENEITQLVIPDDVTSISSYAFKGCSHIESVSIPDNVTSIGTSAFNSCTYLDNISIGSGIETNGIGQYAFSDCPYLMSVTCKAEYPPLINANVFEGCGVLSQIDLFVPEESIKRYQKADVWSEFNIIGVDFNSGSTLEKYEITWLNADGSELYTDSLEYGAIPEYNGETPKKDSTAVYAFTFTGWKPKIAAVTGDAIYIAQFESHKIEYNVDVTIPDSIESHGSVTVDGEPTYGDTIIVTAVPDDGYYFDGWSDGNTDNPREIEITGDTAVYPIFKECEEIIVNISQTINKGQSFTFGGQELTTRGTYRDTVVLANGCDSIVVLKLNVLNSKVKFNLRVVVNDETMGTVSGTGAYVSGSEVTITATPASSKYIFVRWYNEDEGIDVYENPYTFTLTRNLQLRAVFRKAPRKTPKANNKNK